MLEVLPLLLEAIAAVLTIFTELQKWIAEALLWPAGVQK